MSCPTKCPAWPEECRECSPGLRQMAREVREIAEAACREQRIVLPRVFVCMDRYCRRVVTLSDAPAAIPRCRSCGRMMRAAWERDPDNRPPEVRRGQ